MEKNKDIGWRRGGEIVGILSWVFGKKEEALTITERQAREEYHEQSRSKLSAQIGPKRLISTTELPAQYNDVKLSGTRVVDGKFCNTVGELKEATEAFYRNK